MRALHILSTLVLCAAPALAQGAFLGVELSPQDPGLNQTEGAAITVVQKPSAASLMGLMAGDIVTQVAESKIATAADLVQSMQHHLPGDIVTLQVLRDGEAIELMGVLGRRPGAPRVQWAPQAPVMPDFDTQLLHDLDQMKLELESLQQMREMPDWPEMGEMPALPPLPQLDFEFGDGFGQLPVDPGDGSMSVQLRYPGDTSPEEQERLTKEAIEKYGEHVEITFEGQGRSVVIQRSHSQSSRSLPEGNVQVPEVPRAPLPPKEQMRDF